MLQSFRTVNMSMGDEKTIWQKSLSQKEFLALEYPAAQNATLRFSNPLPKLYTRLRNQQIGKELLKSREFAVSNRTTGVRISMVYSITLLQNVATNQMEKGLANHEDFLRRGFQKEQVFLC